MPLAYTAGLRRLPVMGKKKKKKKTKKKTKKTSSSTDKGAQGTPQLPGNAVPEAFPGCHVVHDPDIPPWVLEDRSEPFDPEEFGLTPENEDLMPQISIDPDSRIMCLTNHSHTHRRSFFLTLGHRLQGRGGAPLSTGHWRDAEGKRHECTTVIAVLRPRRILEICTVDPAPLKHGRGGDAMDKSGHGGNAGGARAAASSSCVASALDLYSTISDIEYTADLGDVQHNQQSHAGAPVDELRPVSLPFPLGGAGPFLCSQGACGCFTHFYTGTQHAVDLSCPVGTPVLAVGDGTVVEVKDSTTVGGIHASHLFEWNSIMLRIDRVAGSAIRLEKGVQGGGAGSTVVPAIPDATVDRSGDNCDGATAAAPDSRTAGKGPIKDEIEPIFVEYVHIASGSAVVKAGDTVRQGDLLCHSGDIGFCPTPHLHIQVHRDCRKDAPTAPFCFLCGEQSRTFVPSAGLWYNASGPVQSTGAP